MTLAGNPARPAAKGPPPLFAASKAIAGWPIGKGPKGANGPRKAWSEKPTKVKPMTDAKKPMLIAYTVEDGRKGRKSYWTRIGRLFAHEDGKGYDLLLNALPMNGRVVIREEMPREEADDVAAAE